jgi:hypothetical protein
VTKGFPLAEERYKAMRPLMEEFEELEREANAKKEREKEKEKKNAPKQTKPKRK